MYNKERKRIPRLLLIFYFLLMYNKESKRIYRVLLICLSREIMSIRILTILIYSYGVLMTSLYAHLAHLNDGMRRRIL